MARIIESTALTQLESARHFRVHLVDVDFTSGRLGMNDGPKNVVWGGITYYRGGRLLGFSEATETLDLQVGYLNVTVSGVDQAYTALLLSEVYRNRQLRVHRAFLSDDLALVGEPILIWSGRLNQPIIAEDPGSGASAITLRAVNHWYDAERRPGRITNDQSQQAWFPGDRGFQFAGKIPKDLPWGRAPR